MPNTSRFQERLLVASEAIATAYTALALNAGVDAFSITYTLVGVDFGDGWTEDIQSPLGYRGIVKCGSFYNVTEALTSVTLPATVHVGIQGGDANAYAISEDFLVDVAIDAAESLSFSQGIIGVIPANEDILVTGNASTGGTPAGIGTFDLTIQYFV